MRSGLIAFCSALVTLAMLAPSFAAEAVRGHTCGSERQLTGDVDGDGLSDRVLLRARWVHRVLIPVLTIVALGAAIGLSIWNWEPGDAKPIIEGALEMDTLALGISMLCYIAGIATVFLSPIR